MVSLGFILNIISPVELLEFKLKHKGTLVIIAKEYIHTKLRVHRIFLNYPCKPKSAFLERMNGRERLNGLDWKIY